VISGGLAAFGLPVLGALLPILYGTSFASAVLPMLVLGVVGSVSAMAAPVVAFTLARLSSSLLLAINITALVVNVGAAFALIPIAGVWGAVIANSLGVIVRLVLIVEGERRALRMSLMHLGRLILPVVVATLAVASGWVLGIPFSAEPLIQAGVAGVAALLVFLTLIWVLRAGLEQPDANAVASIAPARMRRVMVLALKTITRR
jgi:O-antigen/teichoic acid export membrane protein